MVLSVASVALQDDRDVVLIAVNEDGFALGEGGMALGYGGMVNALAVEFDTFFNPELLDRFENHVSVMTRGFRDPGSSNHSFELGGSASPVDLTDGDHKVRVRYSPVFEQDALTSGLFSSTPHARHPDDASEHAHHQTCG